MQWARMVVLQRRQIGERRNIVIVADVRWLESRAAREGQNKQQIKTPRRYNAFWIG
jgi:hypothetical protein